MPFYHYIVWYIADAKCINTIDGVYLSEKKNLQYKNPKYACEVLKRLKKRYQRDMKTSLNFSDPWELLVATILSAQAKDKQVNKVTKALFKKYRRIKDFSVMKPAELYKYTKSIGLYRNKTKNIIKTAKELHRKFNDKVPMHMEELILFLGGWSGPSFLPAFAWIFIKVIALSVFIIIIRATTVRMKIDRILRTGWTYMIALSVLNLIATFLIFAK